MTSKQHKIVFTGPVGAGKTTAIGVLSDVKPFKTEQIATDITAQRKKTTTIAMDYGAMKLNDDERIHLYGTPGQKRFDFMWDILTEGGIGLVLLLDNASINPINDMKFYMSSFHDFIDQNKMAIGVNFMQPQKGPDLDTYYEALSEMGLNPPVFEVDCREIDDVSKLVQSLLCSHDPWLGV